VQAWQRKRQDHDPAYYAALTVRKAIAERENRRMGLPSISLDRSVAEASQKRRIQHGKGGRSISSPAIRLRLRIS
jgi:hypothetical protein